MIGLDEIEAAKEAALIASQGADGVADFNVFLRSAGIEPDAVRHSAFHLSLASTAAELPDLPDVEEALKVGIEYGFASGFVTAWQLATGGKT